MKRKEIDIYIEHIEAIKNFMEDESITRFQDEIFRVKEFLRRFDSVDTLLSHLKAIEEISYTVKEFLTVDEVAKYLGVSKSMVYKMTSNKEITVYKPTGKAIYIQRNDLLKWLKRNPILSDEDIKEKAILKIHELDSGRYKKGDKR